MKKQVIVTTSWDDGDPLDMRVMELLRMRGLPGTFYVPICGYLGRRTVQSQDMRDMVNDGFEIGAHSYSHRSLDGLEDFELQREVRHCRTRLEDAIGQPVTMFCYPNGRYDQATLDFVKKAGYTGARTTRMLRTDAGGNRFQVPTTVQAFPHPPLTYVKNALKGHNVGSLAKLSRSIYSSANWVVVGMRTFDYVLKHGGVWHLYGHSWELEDFRLWGGLRTLLDYVAQRDGVQYLTNGDMAERVYGNRYVPSEVAA
jgi:peptidoglycan/xylan/chitin deacetylase (PgdA/CDA1 family)